MELPDWIGASESLAFDIETNASTDVISGQVTALSFSDGIHAHFVDARDHPELCEEMLNHLFERKEIIGHNLAFDLMFCKQWFGVDYPAQLYDTQIAEQLLTAGLNDLEVGLDDVALRRCGVVLDKSLQLSFGSTGPFTPEQEAYSVSDVRLLHEIKRQQLIEITQHELEGILNLELAVLPIFAEMVRVGVEVDLERLRPLIEATTIRHSALKDTLQLALTPLIHDYRIAKRDAMQHKLDAWQAEYDAAVREAEAFWDGFMHTLPHNTPGFEMTPVWIQNKWTDEKINQKDNKPEGMRRYTKARMKTWRESHPRPLKPVMDIGLINLNSQPQMIEAFERLGIHFPDFKALTIATVLSNTENEEHRQLLTSLLAYKKVEKLLSSFGEPLVQKIAADGRLHGGFRQIGTGTGRPSCSQPNMLQMPKRGENKKFRSVFVPRDGCLFVKADYSQMELRIMAQRSADTAMQRAFQSGLDLHTYTASLMFKVPFESVNDTQRATAKTINFGILYGMGPNKLRATLAGDGIRMSREEARAAIELWKHTSPKAARMIREWRHLSLQQGWTSTSWGRKRFFDIANIKDDEMRFAIQRAGANHPIQGGNADITKMAMALVHHYLDGCGTIVLNVYDELVVEVPREQAPWAREVVERCMNIAAQDVLVDVPSVVDAKISTSWSDADELRTA